MTSRRTFLAAVALLATPLTSIAQRPGTVPRIGMLLTGTASKGDAKVAAFRQGLRELGYAEGQIAIEPRWADVAKRMPELAANLVELHVDIIVTQGTPAAKAAQQATRTIPIVMATIADPVAVGLVASFARPGGNITGQTILSFPLAGKRLELLKEIVPRASRVAALWNPDNPIMAPERKVAETTARKLGLALQPLEVRRASDFEGAFEVAAKERAEALLVQDDPLFTAHRMRIAELAARNRLPAMYGLSGIEEAGGLASYGVSLPERFRSAAVYVDKILKGAKPADLPIGQPTKFELIVNLKAARALGVTIPQSVVVRADAVIQ